MPTGGAMGDTGLNQGTRTAGGAGWGNYQIGGAIQGQSAQFIDGAANNLLGGNIVALVPTQDAVQEFSVISNNATADFGRYGGGVVNMTTKSGTNAFHGSACEYLRNADFNANDWFSNQSGIARAKLESEPVRRSGQRADQEGQSVLHVYLGGLRELLPATSAHQRAHRGHAERHHSRGLQFVRRPAE